MNKREMIEALDAQVDAQQRAPRLAEQRTQINGFIRRNASWPNARGEQPAAEAEQTGEQPRDEAGRFTTGGLDQGSRGGAATPQKGMNAILRRRFGVLSDGDFDE